MFVIIFAYYLFTFDKSDGLSGSAKYKEPSAVLSVSRRSSACFSKSKSCKFLTASTGTRRALLLLSGPTSLTASASLTSTPVLPDLFIKLSTTRLASTEMDPLPSLGSCTIALFEVVVVFVALLGQLDLDELVLGLLVRRR